MCEMQKRCTIRIRFLVWFTCANCDTRMSYGDYVKYIAHNDPKYSDILSDYSGSTEGEHAGSLEDWE